MPVLSASSHSHPISKCHCWKVHFAISCPLPWCLGLCSLGTAGMMNHPGSQAWWVFLSSKKLSCTPTTLNVFLPLSAGSAISNFTIGDLLFSLPGLVTIKRHTLVWAGTCCLNNYPGLLLVALSACLHFGREGRERAWEHLPEAIVKRGRHWRQNGEADHPPDSTSLSWLVQRLSGGRGCSFVLKKEQFSFFFFSFSCLNLLKL